MNMLFKKTLLLALAVALAAAAIPFAGASAAGPHDPPVPPQGRFSDERLERVWDRQLRTYERIGRGFDRADRFTARVQEWIDRAGQNGKDVSAVQAALDAFEAALQEAHPIYQSAQGIVNSHQGFDEDGQVTDAEKAEETVRAMGEKLREIRAAMNGTGRALLEALRAFREANPPPERLPAS